MAFHRHTAPVHSSMKECSQHGPCALVHAQASIGDGPSTSSTITGTFSGWLQGCVHTAGSAAQLPTGLAAGALLRAGRGRALQQQGRGALRGVLLARSAAPSHAAHGAMSASRRAMWSLSRSSSGGMLGNFFAPGRRATNALVVIGVAVYLLEQRYPFIVALLARVSVQDSNCDPTVCCIYADTPVPMRPAQQ